MNKITESFFNAGTWTFTIAGIATNFETVKSLILFVMGFIFLTLQIIYQWKKIKEIKNENK